WTSSARSGQSVTTTIIDVHVSRTWHASCSSAETVRTTSRRTPIGGGARAPALRTAAPAVAPDDLDALEHAVGLDDVINMQFTSGTTGFPKGVMLSSRNIVNNGYLLGQGLGFTPDDPLGLGG